MIERADKVRSKLKLLAIDGKKMHGVGAVVGYTMNYAAYVHENPTMKLKGQKRPTKGRYWDPQGIAQNKFLEQPFRTNINEINEEIEDAYKLSGDLQKSLLAGAAFLLRKSQELVPVESGALKASGFIATLQQIEARAKMAKSKGEAKKKAFDAKYSKKGKKK